MNSLQTVNEDEGLIRTKKNFVDNLTPQPPLLAERGRFIKTVFAYIKFVPLSVRRGVSSFAKQKKTG